MSYHAPQPLDAVLLEPSLTVADLLEMAVRDNPTLLTEIFSAGNDTGLTMNLTVMLSSACTYQDARKYLDAKGFRPAVLP